MYKYVVMHVTAAAQTIESIDIAFILKKKPHLKLAQ